MTRRELLAAGLALGVAPFDSLRSLRAEPFDSLRSLGAAPEGQAQSAGRRLIELRERAKQALGDRFSLRNYHNVVLTTGVVPLEILAREIERYIGRTCPPSRSCATVGPP